ncbi:MAG: mechanosensitive ion channel protein MscS [Rhodobacterales bacterium]|nr:MAG: mechanosensitive ion channel protein MscS [Rhodobacterales bacterium]
MGKLSTGWRLLPAMMLAAVLWALGAGAMAQGAAAETAAAEPAAIETSAAEPPAPTSGPLPPELAQVWSDIEYREWQGFADRVETALESGRVSDSVLGDLRRELVDWRATFASAKEANSVRIGALEAQIAALGAAPAEGGGEPEGMAETRAGLVAELDKVLAPVTRATLAHARAELLIGTLDASLRNRTVSDVSARGPNPFNYAAWLPAFESFQRSFSLAWAAALASWSIPSERPSLLAALPVTLPLGAIGLVLLVFGWRTLRRVGERLRVGKSPAVRGAWGFVVSGLQVLVPGFGAILLGAAVDNSFVLDTRGEQIVSAFIGIAVVQFMARWLGNRVFGIPGSYWRVLKVSNREVRMGYALAATLGGLVGLQMLVVDLARIDAWSEATLAVLDFPLILATAVVLWRFGRLLALYRGETVETGEDDDRSQNFYTSTVRALGNLVTLVAIAAPLAAALGYRSLAVFLLFPTIYTLATVAFLMVLHHFITDLFALIVRRSRDEAAQSLVPVLFSVAAALAATPLILLIWGFRWSDITEIWVRIWSGIHIGENLVITPTTVLTAGLVFGIGYAVTRLLQGMLGSTILPKTGMDPGGQVALTSGVGYVGLFVAALAAVTAAGIDLTSLAFVAGALSLGIGFGLQNIVSNFVSGIILLIERPISKGDRIEVGTTMGIVRDISVRSTRIETFDRSDVIVPNSDLISGVVTNYTHGNSLGRVILPVGVAYGTDTRLVERILREVAEAHPLVTVNPAPLIVFSAFGADSLDFEVRVILSDVRFGLSVRSELNHEIARRFTEEGIEIPFAQRDIWLRNPEALNGGTGGAAPGAEAPTAPGADAPIAPGAEAPMAPGADAPMAPDAAT